MSTMMKNVRKRQDQILSFVDRVEEPVVKFAGRVSTSVSGYVPERPKWSFMAELPTVKEVVENQIEFTSKLVDRQTKMAHKMVAAVTTETPRRKVATKPMTVKPMPKAAARKPAPKRPARSLKIA